YNEERGYHYQWFHFAIRERLLKQHGTAGNHVMWRGPVHADRAWRVFVDWVATRTRPVEAVDGCFLSDDPRAGLLAGHQTFSRNPDSQCNEKYPSYGFTRLVAGGPLDASILKCQLKPIDRKDYAVAFSADEMRRLEQIFAGGVCDWSKDGVNQVRVVPWA